MVQMKMGERSFTFQSLFVKLRRLNWGVLPFLPCICESCQRSGFQEGTIFGETLAIYFPAIDSTSPTLIDLLEGFNKQSEISTIVVRKGKGIIWVV
jgi:hypothetical protein